MSMRTQAPRFIRPVMQALCIALAASVAATAQAQVADRIETSIQSVVPDGFPLVLQHNYELGSETRAYGENGEYVEVAPMTLGVFKSLTIGDITIPVGASTQIWFGGCIRDILLDWLNGCILIRIR